MFKKICFICLMFTGLFLGCGGGGGSSKKSDGTLAENKLLGTWAMPFDNGCIESFEFNPDFTFYQYSGDETIFGTYSLIDKGNNIYSLTITIEHDNNKADCQGNNNDTTGLSATTDIVIFENPDKFLFTEIEGGYFYFKVD